MTVLLINVWQPSQLRWPCTHRVWQYSKAGYWATSHKLKIKKVPRTKLYSRVVSLFSWRTTAKGNFCPYKQLKSLPISSVRSSHPSKHMKEANRKMPLWGIHTAHGPLIWGLVFPWITWSQPTTKQHRLSNTRILKGSRWIALFKDCAQSWHQIHKAAYL